MRIIAFTGDRTSGKDTCIDRLNLLLDSPVARVGFSDPLYEAVAALFGVNVTLIHERKDDPRWGVDAVTGHSTTQSFLYRDMLERMGTEVGREIFGQDFWVAQGMRRISEYLGTHTLVAVRDLRFDNEALALKAQNAVIVKVVGPEGTEPDADGHASRKGINPGYVDFTINNERRDDGFAALDAQLVALVESL